MNDRKHNHFAIKQLPRFLYHNSLDLLFFAHVHAILILARQTKDVNLTIDQAAEHFRETYSLEEEEYNNIKARRKYYEMANQKKSLLK